MAQECINRMKEYIRDHYPDYATETKFYPSVTLTRLPGETKTMGQRTVFVTNIVSSQASSTFNLPPQNHKASPNLLPSPSISAKIPTSINSRKNHGPSVTGAKSTTTTAMTSISVKDRQFSGVPGAQESHTREDLSLYKVLHFLRELTKGRNEPMFVISQLKFSSYLGELGFAKSLNLLLPKHLEEKYRQGDFDILLIHRHYGVLVGEIKSVMSNQQDLDRSQQEIDADISKKIRQAIKQTDKSETVLYELTKDLTSKVPIQKRIFLPYVTRYVLQRVLSSDEKLSQELVQCFHTSDTDQAIKRCVLADDLSVSQNQEYDSQLKALWSEHANGTLDNTCVITEDLYLDLLARFVGPATTVPTCSTYPWYGARTEGEGISLLGERMMSMFLTEEEACLLDTPPAKVMLTGGPGVGKSLMLELIALQSLTEDYHVHFVSLKKGSLAATYMLKNLVESVVRNDSAALNRIHLHNYDFDNNDGTDVDEAIRSLTDKRAMKQCIICDEFWVYDRSIHHYYRFVMEVCATLPDVILWTASPFYHQVPKELQEERLTIPLRYPPAVLENVEEGFSEYSNVRPYRDILPPSCDWQQVYHLSHQEPGHVKRWPIECENCGHNVATLLKQIGVGGNGQGSNGTGSSKSIPPPPLQYRDVFILTASKDLRDDVKDENGTVTSEANGFVRGLRAASVPVRVIKKQHEPADVYDMAVAKSDAVTVTYYGVVPGLERKVVVWLPHRIEDEDDDKSDKVLEARGRFNALSRCTAQLIVVHAALSQ